MTHTLSRLAVLCILVLALLAPMSAGAQSNSQYFPETGYTVSGRFLEFWRSNGGLAVFGFPISEQLEENGLQAQYFERQRFELHPENARPYDVLLGRLGAELMGAMEPPEAGPRQGCQWFVETRHNVCNFENSPGFLDYWRSNGLEFDGRAGKSFAESLALFGFPLSGVITRTNSSGDTVETQWFERARFEWHPENPAAYRVLLGRLGVESRQTQPPGTTTMVKVFVVTVGDNGASGRPIGCGDSLIGVDSPIEPTSAPLRAALELLLGIRPNDSAEGYYNALDQSDLQIDSLAIQDGLAVVRLSGQLRVGGVCDEPRVVEQLEATVRQFPTVTDAEIFINGVALADVFGQ